jgi:hypothetical protein
LIATLQMAIFDTMDENYDKTIIPYGIRQPTIHDTTII